MDHRDRYLWEEKSLMSFSALSPEFQVLSGFRWLLVPANDGAKYPYLELESISGQAF